MTDMIQIGKRSKEAQRILAAENSSKISAALNAVANALEKDADYILAANAADIKAGIEGGLREAFIDRLTLTQARIEDMANGLRKLAAADSPVGKVLWGEKRPNGLRIEKVAVPIGVIAVIFESRPNVTADAAGICLKAGNSVILRGGKEAINSNKAIADIMRRALGESGLPEDCVILIESTSRQSATELMHLNGYVDLLIPRGGAGLIRSVIENATVPVIETGTGNCHVYVDAAADIEKAANIVVNAKTTRVSVCNACESLLVHKDIAETALLIIGERLREKGVTIRGDEAVCVILPYAEPATEEDWGREYLDLIISAKVVDDVDEAIAHINKYGTGHSEAIVTENYSAAEAFTSRVDAAAVYVNASTRFTDGGEFGFGAEIGISTQKLHARGPLGVAQMVSEKYIVRGDGQIR